MTDVMGSDPGYTAAPEGPDGFCRLIVPASKGPSVAYRGPDASREPR